MHKAMERRPNAIRIDNRFKAFNDDDDEDDQDSVEIGVQLLPRYAPTDFAKTCLDDRAGADE